MESVIFGVDNSAGGFFMVCAGSKGVLVLETSETGVISFGKDLVGLLMFSLSSDVRIELDGQGARSETETVTSLPLLSRTFAKLGLASSSSTSSTKGSCLFLIKRQSNISPGCINQLGRVRPTMLRLSKPRKRSCGVAFVALQNKDRTECKALGSTASHVDSGC